MGAPDLFAQRDGSRAGVRSNKHAIHDISVLAAGRRMVAGRAARRALGALPVG
jgi:hypothetical protein